MAQLIKLTDNNYIDASGVYDSTQSITQEQFNSHKAVVKTGYVVDAGQSILLYGALNSIVIAISTNAQAFASWIVLGYQCDSTRSTIKRLDDCTMHTLQYGPSGSNYFTFTNTNSGNSCYVTVVKLA